ncbi:MAG: chromate transporter, partial [Pseudomonadota bacterium]
VLTFGGAYALLAWLAQEAVSRGWVTALEMADGLGLAETTPGPTILVNQFVGFLAAWREPGPFSPLVAAVLGALMTTWVTFAPSFLWIFAGAPYVEDLRANARIAAALRAISAAVVGVVAYLGVWFALHVVFTEVGTLELGPVRLAWPVFGSIDLAAAALALLAFALVFVARLGILPVVAIMAAAGVTTRFLV